MCVRSVYDSTKKTVVATVEIKRYYLLGVPLDNLSLAQTLEAVDEMVRSGGKGYVVTPNVDHIIQVVKNPFLAQIYENAVLSLADGMPVLWAMRFLRKKFGEKVSGSDLMPGICRLSALRGYRVFLMGGRKGIADRAARGLQNRFPTLTISDTYSPSFEFEHNQIESERMVNRVNASNSHILLMCCGTPKSELWILNNIAKLGINVAFSLGASIDLAAGQLRRAPRFLQYMGLEWFWRLYHEPRRLWRRYLVEDVPFFWFVLKQKMTQLRGIQ